MFRWKQHHHIDSSIYLEAFKREDFGYIKTLGYKYKCGICIVCLGEIINKLVKFAKDRRTREEFLENIGLFILRKGVKVHTITDKDLELYDKIRSIETRAHPPELLALAVAIKRKANVYRTLDNDILESEKLRSFAKKHGVTIK